MKNYSLTVVALAAIAFGLGSAAFAESYPTKPIC